AARAESGFEFDGPLREAWTSGKPVHVPDLQERETAAAMPWLGGEDGVRTVRVCPLLNSQGDVRYLLGLVSLGAVRPLSARQVTLVARAAQALGAALGRIGLHRRRFETLDGGRPLARAQAPHTLFQRAAEAAVDPITGAEAASVLVRDGDLFRFEAAVGYDLGAIKDGAGPFTVSEQ